MLLFISSLLSVWNPLGSNPEHIKAHGIRPASQEYDALRRVDLQSRVVEAGVQLSWNVWFGASAKAGQKCFDWRMLICEDQSITQGQFGFNQRLMKKWFWKLYQSLSAYLPSTSAACPESWWGSKSPELPPQLPPLVWHSWGAAWELPSSWLLCSFSAALMWHWDFGFPVCSSSAVSCPAVSRPARYRTARASVLDWPSADSAKILSFHPNEQWNNFWNFKTLPSAKHNLLALLCYL